MNTVKEIEIKNLTDYISYIESNMSANELFWYRGTKINYSLVPSFYRNNNSSYNNDFIKLEKDITNKFKERSLPYLNPSPLSFWTVSSL